MKMVLEVQTSIQISFFIPFSCDISIQVYCFSRPFGTITPLHSMLSWTLSVKFALMEIGITLQIFRLIHMGCMSHELISGITVRNPFFYLSMTILLDLSHGTIYHK